MQENSSHTSSSDLVYELNSEVSAIDMQLQDMKFQ